MRCWGNMPRGCGGLWLIFEWAAIVYSQEDVLTPNLHRKSPWKKRFISETESSPFRFMTSMEVTGPKFLRCQGVALKVIRLTN